MVDGSTITSPCPNQTRSSAFTAKIVFACTVIEKTKVKTQKLTSDYRGEAVTFIFLALFFGDSNYPEFAIHRPPANAMCGRCSL